MPIPSIGLSFLDKGLLFNDTDGGSELPDFPKLPQISQATFIGILVAVSGNIVISLALNFQKLAHKRLERERSQEQELQSQHSSSSRTDDDTQTARQSLQEQSPIREVTVVETEPLLGSRNSLSSATYGTSSVDTLGQDQPQKRQRMLARLFSFRNNNEHPCREVDASHLATTHAILPVDVIAIPTNRDGDPREHRTSEAAEGKGASQSASEGDYLKSKLWWLGFFLMNVGELGNFISYAFAPASVVAPLGTFALIANCIFAPLMLKERFRKRDFLGIAIAIVGAVTVVLSSNPSDTRLGPEGLIHAVTQHAFLAYTALYIACAITLSWLSEREAGKKWVYVDIGLCAIFGGFTVLSTKAISTLLTMEGINVFAEWITYPIVTILVGTGVGQIRYLNRALIRFDSKIVVPTQFVFFNLSAIVGSAILYGDFVKASFHQIVTFLYGCGATFAGVFIIAWAPATNNVNEDAYLPNDILGSEAGTTGATSISGSLSRSNRFKLMVPEGAAPSPILRARHSIVSMYGLSPAQRVLLLSSSPRDEFVRPHSQDPERGLTSTTPDSLRRRRTVSWIGEGAGQSRRRPIATPNFGTRESSRNRAQSTTTTTGSRSVSRSPL